MKFTEDWYQYTEKLLYKRKYWDSVITDLEREVTSIMPQSSFSVIKMGGRDDAGGNKDDTSRYAVDRADGPAARRLAELKRKREAIQEAKKALTDEENTLVWMKYDLEYTDRYTHRQLMMRWEDYSIQKRHIIIKISKHLGLIPECPEGVCDKQETTVEGLERDFSLKKEVGG